MHGRLVTPAKSQPICLEVVEAISRRLTTDGLTTPVLWTPFRVADGASALLHTFRLQCCCPSRIN